MIINSKKEKEYFADLHIHSRFSRACSTALNVENLEKWAKIKGVDLLGTGDFTHPEWLGELKQKLNEEQGILYTQSGFKFVLTGEISLIYTQGHGRRIHLVMLAPNFEVVDKINSYLDTKGRRDYDGRPIFKISCEEFVKEMNKISDKIEIIPAHIWTPWFGLFGSASGFDSLEEAFGSQVDKIHAIETGISSTPQMNLRLKQLQNKTIVSFSDLHSFWPWRLGREATIFSSIGNYNEILNAIRDNTILGTVEVNPAYGKYHFDGHRLCKYSCSVQEAKKQNNTCLICNKPLLLGVEHRVSDLSDEPENFKFTNQKKVYDILPLHEIISLARISGVNTKKVWDIYNKLIEEFGNEFEILIKTPREKLASFVDEKTVDLILRNREGKIRVKPGYDGVYGEALLEEKKEKLF